MLVREGHEDRLAPRLGAAKGRCVVHTGGHETEVGAGEGKKREDR